MKLHLSGHSVHADTFQALKDAFPWLYKKSGSIEWVEIHQDEDDHNLTISVFKARP